MPYEQHGHYMDSEEDWKMRDYITRVLDSFTFYHDIGIKVLIEKALVTVSNGRILMHPLIQEMGWHIVHHEAPEKPGKQSRLWVEEDIYDVLARGEVTENVKFWWLDMSTPEKAWIGYLMRYGGLTSMDTLQNSFQIAFKLKNLYVSSYDATILFNCGRAKSLIEIHPSAGQLKRLQLLNLRNCTNLGSLPKRIFLERLEVMILSGCSKVDEFPEILGTMDCPSLTMLFLQATSLKELPPSIFEHLPSLVFLNLSHSKNLTSLPSSFGRLKCLKILNLCFCSTLDKLPVGLMQLQSLQELYIEENVISKRPCSFELLEGFKFSTLGERIERHLKLGNLKIGLTLIGWNLVITLRECIGKASLWLHLYQNL
ncbi:hypothetical protein ACH5RR_038871 [Cinchona calisaya]|uniref:Uncharacterized protein n=1 Tax=Cinchona calisaya TaxID=153742 RepID=A0ABD2XXY1_9GENT